MQIFYFTMVYLLILLLTLTLFFRKNNEVTNLSKSFHKDLS